MRRLLVLALLVSCSLAAAWPQGVTAKGELAIAVNPVKVAMSLVNLELDYCAADHLSIHGFCEYLVDDYAIKREEHPDLVVRLGPRFRFDLLGGGFDTYLGPFASYSYSSTNADGGLEVGAEIGLRLRAYKRSFIQLKGMAMYSFGAAKVMPGFEGLLGFVL